MQKPGGIIALLDEAWYEFHVPSCTCKRLMQLENRIGREAGGIKANMWDLNTFSMCMNMKLSIMFAT